MGGGYKCDLMQLGLLGRVHRVLREEGASIRVYLKVPLVVSLACTAMRYAFNLYWGAVKSHGIHHCIISGHQTVAYDRFSLAN